LLGSYIDVYKICIFILIYLYSYTSICIYTNVYIYVCIHVYIYIYMALILQFKALILQFKEPMHHRLVLIVGLTNQSQGNLYQNCLVIDFKIDWNHSISDVRVPGENAKGYVVTNISIWTGKRQAK